MHAPIEGVEAPTGIHNIYTPTQDVHVSTGGLSPCMPRPGFSLHTCLQLKVLRPRPVGYVSVCSTDGLLWYNVFPKQRMLIGFLFGFSELGVVCAPGPCCRPLSPWVPMGSHAWVPMGFRPGFLWFSPGFLWVFALGSYGFRPGFPWFSPWVPMVFALGSYGFRLGSYGLPCFDCLR